jgi:hypothetical protein
MKELKAIFIDSTNKTPLIDFNNLTGELILSGKSIPEDANKIFEPVHHWITEYITDPRSTTNLRLNLEYFNTSSSIWIGKIIKTLSKMKDPENVLLVHLYFNVEDYDNMETEDIKDVLSPVVDIISTAAISIGVKIYGTDDKSEVIKESMVLI